jgi:hypothetical protein
MSVPQSLSAVEGITAVRLTSVAHTGDASATDSTVIITIRRHITTRPQLR